MLVEKKDNKEIYALKSIRKEEIIDKVINLLWKFSIIIKI